MNLFAILSSWPTSPSGWLSLIAVLAVVVFLAGAVIFFVVKLLRDGKIDQLRVAIVDAIKEAEKTHASGAEKKEIAINVVKKFCADIGLNLNDQLLKWVADYIDGYIKDHNELELIEEEEGK